MLYNLGIFIYGILINIAALWSDKARLWINGRKEFWHKLPGIDQKKEVVWFHCASLGEYDQGLPVMQRFKKDFPNCFILVTFFSPSGYEAKKAQSIGDYTSYLPLDTPRNASRFVNHFKPKKVFFIKYEYWLNYIDACSLASCRIFGLSSVFRENQRFFKPYRLRFSEILDKFEHFFVQDEASAVLLSKNNQINFSLSGDTRYDRVDMRARQNPANKYFEHWKTASKLLVVGSSWPRDEQLLIPLINQQKIDVKVIIAPHEVNAQHIHSLTAQLSVPYQLYTALEKGDELKKETNVVILDCIGVLANAYKYGDVAYVGGGFKTGLHNILEPAAFGLPVVFGPKHQKFPEAKHFIHEGIGQSINNIETCKEALQGYLADEHISKKVKKFIASNLGATEKVMTYFQP